MRCALQAQTQAGQMPGRSSLKSQHFCRRWPWLQHRVPNNWQACWHLYVSQRGWYNAILFARKYVVLRASTTHFLCELPSACQLVVQTQAEKLTVYDCKHLGRNAGRHHNPPCRGHAAVALLQHKAKNGNCCTDSSLHLLMLGFDPGRIAQTGEAECR